MVSLVDCEVPTRIHHLYNVGIYTEDTSEDDQCLFVTELHAFHDLIDGLNKPCSACGVSCPWIVESFTQVHI